MGRIATAILIACLGIAGRAAAADPTELAEAHKLWQTGKYAQAEELLHALLWRPVTWSPEVLAKLALGRAECLASQGKSEQAIATLKEATAWQTGNADVWAHLADLQLARGDWPGAEESAKKAEAA